MKKACPTCGYQVEVTAVVCTQCGQSLSPGSGGPAARRKTQLEGSTAPTASVQFASGGPTASAAGAGRRAGAGTVHEGGSAKPQASIPRSSGGGRPKTMLDTGTGVGPRSSDSQPAPRQHRAVGWMVTFDKNPSGQDYVLRAGRTSVGKGRDADVSLFYDQRVSDQHATILWRPGICAVSDQMSTNGTFVNGEDIGVDKPFQLKNGDVVRFGGTTFKLFLLDEEERSTLWPDDSTKN